MRVFAAVLAMALASEMPAMAQSHVAIDPPSPESRMTREQQITYFLRMAGEDESARNRDRAMKRLFFLYRETGDQPRADEWRERRQRFILEQEAVITAGAPLPAPQRLCNPTESQSTCTYGAISHDEETYWRYGVLAEAAEQRGDYARVVALREAAIPFMYGTSPDVSHWLSLANEARSFGQFDAALRLCAIVQDEPLYDRFSAQGDRCTADTRFAMQDWAGWLASNEASFTGVDPRNAWELTRFCVAATRANRRDIAEQACVWAEASVAARDSEEEERLARRLEAAGDPAARQRIAASPSALRWQQDKARMNSAIAACRTALLTPDGSSALQCGGLTR